MTSQQFTISGQAEIIRASQKDDLITNHIQDYVSDLLFKTAGNRVWLQWRSMLQASSKLLYFGFTTLSNYQTIGEEYTGIVQVDSSRRKLPSKFLRLLMILMDSCGHQAFTAILNRLENDLKQPSRSPDLRPDARKKLLAAVALARQLVPFVLRFHKANFFLHGGYFHLGKRFTRIHYVLVRRWLADRRSDSGFRLLGIVSLLYLLASGAHSAVAWLKAAQPASTTATSTRACSDSLRCSLCMEERRNASVTPCGHLFCWDCVMQWLNTSQRCPLCREAATPSRVVLLQNYPGVGDS